MHLDPAATIIALLGGLSAVAEAADTSTTTVQRWRLPRTKGGSDGYIPRRHHAALIKRSRRIGVALTHAAFLDPSALPRVKNER